MPLSLAMAGNGSILASNGNVVIMPPNHPPPPAASHSHHGHPAQFAAQFGGHPNFPCQQFQPFPNR